MGMDSEDTKVEQACQAGEEFSKLYYDTIDKKRHLLTKLYQDSGEATWNGNNLKGKEAILKFFTDLPTSEHKVESLDCHPLSGSISGGQITIIVKTYGTVKYPNNSLKAFHQSFILTSQNNVWKIISDNFRFQDKSDN
ncbi:NTF2-related export protein 2-like isoform X1 [Ruditapes philippinarum]|uniref:NTF2-related export protein 2-like isoform X1 n=1 Tax=Ruditapes philippinarum TaxID=129788 RepID=UPI00295BCDED|nr:NTF2-related export protein 2-like isoform X1 [Ruditapes philippinarum]